MEGLISFFSSFHGPLFLPCPTLAFSWACGLACCHLLPGWPIGPYFFFSFLSGFHGPLFLPCSTLASSWTCGLACCHLLLGWPIRPYFFLSLFSSFYGPFIAYYSLFFISLCSLLGFSTVGPFFFFLFLISKTGINIIAIVKFCS